MLVKCDHATRKLCFRYGVCKHARNHQHSRECDFACIAAGLDECVPAMVKCLPVKEDSNAKD